MDTDRGDVSSMALTVAASRRTAIGRLVGGGSAAAILTTVGPRRRAAAHQSLPRAGLVGSWKSYIAVPNRLPITTLITYQ